MIKPHTAAKQETKLLGIRGEEKVNEKERVRVTREMREDRGRGRKSVEGKNLFGDYSQPSLRLRQSPTGTKQVIELQAGCVPRSHNSRGWGTLLHQWSRKQKVQ